MKSGRSAPAITTLTAAAKSALGTICSFRFTLRYLLTACHAAFWSTAGGGAYVRATTADTSLPSPGGLGTDLARVVGNLKNAASSPLALPGRSGVGPFSHAR